MRLDPSIKQQMLLALLKPLVRFCLQESATFQELVRLAKQVFVQLAEEELKRAATKVNTSRISVRTGIQRYEVDRILNEGIETEAGSEGLLARVLAQWRYDKRFVTRQGRPKILKMKGAKNEFKELVESVSKSINPGTILFELERLGAVTKTKTGLKLKHIYISVQSDPHHGIELLGNELDALIQSVLENLFSNAETPNLHIRTEYDSIYSSDLEEVRRWVVERGKAFHRDLREYLSRHDRDVTPRPPPDSPGLEEVSRVIVSAFSLCK